ncbi:WD repeat and FYVE domain-containing protein 2-like [Corticium candelabrum]|uniref:WD repeat and FYVE domain-containing protein 2-like n=1 Tax=Corticium candelabrum TaxID=121492 RepID=UPI002E2618C1|nr:WD repeat and FYVE domain-containing protein 2-like [Corticium candelabrum]
MASAGRKKRVAPALLHKVEQFNDDVNDAFIVPHEDAVVTASDDKILRVWLLRESGEYWPSICQNLSSSVSSLSYNGETRRLFVGLGSGAITEFQLSEDFNRISLRRNYEAHLNRVTQMAFSLEHEWLLSVSRDKTFQWHSAESGLRIGGHRTEAWCMTVQFDAESQHAFVGDYSGAIHVIKLEKRSLTIVTTLKGHSGSVRAMAWDHERRLLFSGSYDQTVIVWDIGSQKGTAFELNGHMAPVCGLSYSQHTRKLLSSGHDQKLVVWDMDILRTETPSWKDSDTCELCKQTFFWNVKEMWNRKKVDLNRQHHCRKCGCAVCDKCSKNSTALPKLGFEFPVRVCNDCYAKVTDADQRSTTMFFDMKHEVKLVYFDPTKGHLLTVGSDRVVKLWDVKGVMKE